MFILGNLCIAVANVLDIILYLVFWLIFVRAFISWFNPDPYNALVQFLYRVTEPILEPIRRFMPMMRIDLSPLCVIFGVVFLRWFLVQSLLELGARMKVM